MNVDPRLNEIKDCLYRVATKAIIVHDGKILTVLEKDDDQWNLPGGGIDHGEEPKASLTRELEEEISVTKNKIIKISDPLFVAASTELDGVPRLNIFYGVEVLPSDCAPGRDVKDVKWCTQDEFRTLNLTPPIAKYTKEILNLFLRRTGNLPTLLYK